LFPIIAALPLMAIAAGETTMFIPFFGIINLGIIYSLIVIPIGVTGASNAFNMLAGFNGLEFEKKINIGLRKFDNDIDELLKPEPNVENQ
jgi:hypothetical protein